MPQNARDAIATEFFKYYAEIRYQWFLGITRE